MERGRGQRRQQQQQPPPPPRRQRHNNLAREDLLERAIFIPFRARSSISSLNLPPPHGSSSSPSLHYPEAHARMIRSLIGSGRGGRGSGDNINTNNNNDNTWDGRNRDLLDERSRARMNVSTFFMELTYSTAADPHHHHHFHHHHGHLLHHFKSSSTETMKRRMEIHAANTMAFIKRYCPTKLHKLSQFRYCTRAQKQDFFGFKQFQSANPLQTMEPLQIKCNTKVIVIVKEGNLAADACGSIGSGKSLNSFTSYLLAYLSKKHLNPTCLTFQTDSSLNLLIEQLYTDLHVFSKKVNLHDNAFNKQAKRFLLLSTIAKLVENWNVPLLILDSPVWKIIEIESVLEFGKKFGIKTFEVDSTFNNFSDGSTARAAHAAATAPADNKKSKKEAKRVGRQVVKAVGTVNMSGIRKDLEEKNWQKCFGESGIGKSSTEKDSNASSTRLINDDCQKIVLNLQERMSLDLLQEQEERNLGGKKDCRNNDSNNAAASASSQHQLSMLEDEILADIESSVAFRYSPATTPAAISRQCCSSLERTNAATGLLQQQQSESRPRTGHSSLISDDEAASRDHEKVSELLFNELNQRWRVHGPQRYITSKNGGGDGAGPYCDPLQESEKQLIYSVTQEVANFEMLKDIRNVLKDSKKDLEGRLYGYNPDFSNLIASAEEFLHGKGSCLEPSQEEMEFYKMPVSLVYSEAEVKYMKAKPPVYVMGSESPSQFIKMAIEESGKLFCNAVLHTTCGSRPLSFSKRNKTKAIVVIEENNEVLELLTSALWFFEKTPLATFQSKYCGAPHDFWITIDACRAYFGNFPVHSVKKEDEHIFERWLGVGLNGILRSFQSKVVIIDFPRPSVVLRKSRDILFNRLKIEEKLHKIKSFTVSKPSRKEDNLSTVEHILDEIQNCLAPRDKLLFRKARRMYLDLKLYKQIEQKSRQDLKCLRDWGLPEPDNELGLWERLRTSEFVINTPPPLPPSTTGTSASPAPITSSTASQCDVDNPSSIKSDLSPRDNSEDESDRPTIATDEDFSDSSSCPECENRKVKNKSSNVGRLTPSLSEEDLEEVLSSVQSLPSTTANVEYSNDTTNDHHNHNDFQNDSIPAEFVVASLDEDVNSRGRGRGNVRADGMENAYNLVEILPTRTLNINEESISSISDDADALGSFPPYGQKTKLEVAHQEKANDEISDGSQNMKSSTANNCLSLKRSAGVLNLLEQVGRVDDNKKEEEFKFCDSEGSLSSLKSPDHFKIECRTLAPELDTISNNGSNCLSHEFKIDSDNKDKLQQETVVGEDGDKLAHGDGDNQTNDKEFIELEPKSLSLSGRKRSFHEICTAHLGKLGKTFSKFLLRKRKPRRIAPHNLHPFSLTNQSFVCKNASMDEISLSSPRTTTEPYQGTINCEPLIVLSGNPSEEKDHDRSFSPANSARGRESLYSINSRRSVDENNNDSGNSSWINTFVKYVRTKVQKKKQTI